MTKRLDWVRLPTDWVRGGGLADFRAAQGAIANEIAALMNLIAIAHLADGQTGVARATYDDLTGITGCSREKVARALNILHERELVDCSLGRSQYRLENYDPEAGGWAKLPCRRLYQDDTIAVFSDFHLRKRAELDALKLYLLFITFRENWSNQAMIGFDKINEYTGIHRQRIKTGTSLLVSHGLIHVERMESTKRLEGVKNCYRVIGIDPYNHQGTRGRIDPSADQDEAPF